MGMLTASPTTRSPMRTTMNVNVARATLVTVSTVKSTSHHVTVFNVQKVLFVKSLPPNTVIKMLSASVPRDTLVMERTVAHLVHVRRTTVIHWPNALLTVQPIQWVSSVSARTVLMAMVSTDVVKPIHVTIVTPMPNVLSHQVTLEHQSRSVNAKHHTLVTVSNAEWVRSAQVTVQMDQSVGMVHVPAQTDTHGTTGELRSARTRTSARRKKTITAASMPLVPTRSTVDTSAHVTLDTLVRHTLTAVIHTLLVNKFLTCQLWLVLRHSLVLMVPTLISMPISAMVLAPSWDTTGLLSSSPLIRCSGLAMPSKLTTSRLFAHCSLSSKTWVKLFLSVKDHSVT